MSYLVLARKWRPQRFADVIGQQHVSRTLTNALKTGRLSHAYLFAGPRGIGKTSVARILAKALNCEKGPVAEPCNECDACRAITEGRCLDVLEIDGASNRGIDDVRQLRESVKYAPSSVRSKVYIIDEVHMLTTDAFNALLKTLEEPPKHVFFMMATTEPLKIPATILSRCQRFDFGRLSADDLKGHLARIAESEGVQIEDAVLYLLARKAEGCVRDGLTLLDQVVATGDGPFDTAAVQEILGLSGSLLYFEISEAIAAGDAARALLRLQEAHRRGANLQEVAEELVGHFRNVLLVSLGEEFAGVLETTADERERLKAQLKETRPADALRWLRILLDVAGRMRRSPHARVHLEVALAEMASLPRAVDLAQVVRRLRAEDAGDDTPPAAAGRPGTGASTGERSVPREASRGGGSTAPGGGSTAPGAGNASPGVKDASRGSQQAAPGTAEPAVMATDAPLAGSLADTWLRVVERVRERRAFLGSCLHMSQAVGVSEGRVNVVLDDTNGFKRDQVEKTTNRRLILRALEEALGRPLGIRIISAAEAVSAVGGDSRMGTPPGAETSSTERRAGEDRQSPTARECDGARRIARLMDGDIVGPAH